MIGILVFPDFQLLDAAGPISVFEIAARYAAVAPSIKVLAVTPGPVRSSSGVELLARGLKPSGAISTLIVAGGEGVRAAAACDKTLAFVRAMAKRGVRVASVCSGAYILAEAGLLDGRRATTHWQRTRHFLAAYPRVKLEPDRIFVREGNIWSSAGISAGIEADRSGAAARAIHRRGDRARGAIHRLSRSGANAPRLRPAAAIATPRGKGGVALVCLREFGQALANPHKNRVD
jgi:transcriptional regulator GlxA family with amidase domain